MVRGRRDVMKGGFNEFEEAFALLKGQQEVAKRGVGMRCLIPTESQIKCHIKFN